MKASVLFRVAAVLIALFAIGHTLGFRQIDPQWKIDEVITGMRSARFQTQGFARTYWDFYVGFGLFVSVLLLFAAWLAWQVGDVAASGSRLMRSVAWGLILVFGAIVLLSWRFFFMAPLLFSAIIFFLLLTATVLTPAVELGSKVSSTEALR